MSDQWFVEVPVTVDASALSESAKEQVASQVPGWASDPADLDTIIIDAIAPMMQNANETTALVPDSIFRAYGTKLVGRAYVDGTPATTVMTITAVNSAGYTIQAGTEFDIDGFAFATTAEYVIPPGSTSKTGVQLAATENGTEANAATGAVVTPITALSWYASAVVTTPPSGGTDAEDDLDYQNNLSRDLLLQAKTLVTTRDYELWALNYAEIGRAVATHLGDRAVRVTAVKADGTVVSTPTKNALLADYANYRLVNTVVTLQDPLYTTVHIAYTVKAVPGYDVVDLVTRINSVLTSFLSPGDWGAPKGTELALTSGWLDKSIVRRNEVIDRIGDVEGVDYVHSVDITATTPASGATFTGNITNTSPIVTNVSSMTNVQPGVAITGAGIPAGARVLTVDSATQFTLDANASATTTGVTLTPTASAKVDGTNQQTLLDFGGTVTGGTYTVTADGQTTAAINWNATGQQVVDAIVALSKFEPGDLVYISGGPGPTDIILEWRGRYARRAVTVSVASSLTGTAPTLVASIQQAAVNGSGDLAMPGYVALPLAGTMTGNAI